MTYPDGFAVFHNYLVTGEMTQISQPGGIFAPPSCWRASAMTTSGGGPRSAA
jgi:hypothetical protein